MKEDLQRLKIEVNTTLGGTVWSVFVPDDIKRRMAEQSPIAAKTIAEIVEAFQDGKAEFRDMAAALALLGREVSIMGD